MVTSNMKNGRSIHINTLLNTQSSRAYRREFILAIWSVKGPYYLGIASYTVAICICLECNLLSQSIESMRTSRWVYKTKNKGLDMVTSKAPTKRNARKKSENICFSLPDVGGVVVLVMDSG